MKSVTDLALGDVAKDTITGFTGVVVCISYWLNGCIRIVIQPRDLKDGKPVEALSFDVEQLEAVERKVAKEGTRSGGPAEDAKRGCEVRR